MYCTQCGAKIEEEFKFCPECGSALGNGNAPMNDSQSKLIKCPDCGKPMPDNVKFCPYCGLQMPSLQYGQNPTKRNKMQGYQYYVHGEQQNFHEKQVDNYSSPANRENQGKHYRFRNGCIVVGILFLCGLLSMPSIILSNAERNGLKKEKAAEKERTKQETIAKNKAEIKAKKEAEDEEKAESEDNNALPDYSALPEEDYKASCEELWHDDIFFSEESLEGKLVKLDLFVEESNFFDTIPDSSTSVFIKEFDLQRSFYLCGVKRYESNSYMSPGQVGLFFSNSCGYSAGNMSEGDHLILYGQVVHYAKDYWDGYNECYVIPRYIENNGQ